MNVLTAMADINQNTNSMTPPVTCDRYGRMNYHPAFHAKHKTAWLAADQQYLIDNYEAMGPDQLSFALERTIHTVMTRAYELRRDGLMNPATQRVWHKRCKNLKA